MPHREVEKYIVLLRVREPKKSLDCARLPPPYHGVGTRGVAKTVLTKRVFQLLRHLRNRPAGLKRRAEGSTGPDGAREIEKENEKENE